MKGINISGIDEYLDRVSSHPDGFFALMGFSDAMNCTTANTEQLLLGLGYHERSRVKDDEAHTITILYSRRGSSVIQIIEKAGCGTVMQITVMGRGGSIDSVLKKVGEVYKRHHPALGIGRFTT